MDAAPRVNHLRTVEELGKGKPVADAGFHMPSRFTTKGSILGGGEGEVVIVLI